LPTAARVLTEFSSTRRQSNRAQPPPTSSRKEGVSSTPLGVRRLVPGAPEYPSRLLDLSKPPPELYVAGEMATAPVIALIGTRTPTPGAREFARELAAAVVRRGAIVLSGGAIGIDTASHEGAMEAMGTTWVVAATGCRQVFPRENVGLFGRVVSGGGVMFWPFAEDRKASPLTFFSRNGVLAALADALVVIQADAPSGTLNAASWARRLGRTVWAVCAPPWIPGFAGCARAIELGARPLASVESFLKANGLADRRAALPRRRNPRDLACERPCSKRSEGELDRETDNPGGARAALLRRAGPSVAEAAVPRLSPAELQLLSQLSFERAEHVDEIVIKTGMSTAEVSEVLLTLALEAVVVEEPEGFFRRCEQVITV
jgi:DNA processing protein